jgi:hypothetical protein
MAAVFVCQIHQLQHVLFAFVVNPAKSWHQDVTSATNAQQINLEVTVQEARQQELTVA